MMNNIILHNAPAGAELITAGTERFNMIIPEYPTHFLVSNSRRIKYVHPADLKKYEKFVERTEGSKVTPVFYMEGVEKGRYKWLPVMKGKERLFNVVKNEFEKNNSLQRRIDTGELAWFYRNGKQTLGHCILGKTTRVLDITQGEKGFFVANSKTAGTEKWQKISGQMFWVGGDAMQWNRGKFKVFMTAFYNPFIARQLPPHIHPPVGKFIHLEFIFYVPLGEAWMTVAGDRSEAQDIDNHGYPYIKSFVDTLLDTKVITSDSHTVFRGYAARYVRIENAKERRMEIKFHFCSNEEQIVPRMHRIDNLPTHQEVNNGSSTG